ncbi:xanthine dehydrogenase accessory protein XdhC [Aquirhabdus parva]|uniref:Xanthine dehydrogenase accessory protein XdhC n=1 Tax=Aquirhabdus parva TaxID=2283318 RepID=A0A345P876_9GAMM|nr:xanthine dehydrogenase accessory protein XdhC [Aquirhabdus parva]AXI03485.1 xanthine dehydrogenase accessory protein XdhC [Aquirhabdus parva]
MKAWLNTLPTWLLSRDCVLVTVARVEGSTPREAGASMLIGVDETGQTLQVDTIGGGHLEWQATDIAQKMLAGSEPIHPIHFERFNLSARLGQCCGGVVWLIFEKIAPDHSQSWQAFIKALEQGACLLRTLRHDQSHSTWTTQSTGKNRVQLDHSTAKKSTVGKSQTPETLWQFEQEILGSPFTVYLFGAGHVGRAVVEALRPLDAKIRWIDSRDHGFPEHQEAHIDYVSSDEPEDEIARAPANSYFLIMTHNHALDFRLCLALFKRNDFAYFGLIGSESKRAVFEHRLHARGVDTLRFQEMTCPIGIQGIYSKEPALIAVSVVAQMLQVHTTRLQTERIYGGKTYQSSNLS